MKKVISVFLCVVMLAVTCIGCGKSVQGQNVALGKVKIFVSTASDSDEFNNLLLASIEETAGNSGIEYEVQCADSSIEKQVEQIAGAREKGYDVIICRLVDANTALQVEKAAGDLPVVFINNSPSADRLKEDKYVFVGSDEKVAGMYQAEYVLDRLSGKSELNVVLLKGEMGHSATKGRTEYSKLMLEESGKKINYVFEDYANWSTDISAQYMSIFLKQEIPVDCVIANNDLMALGAVEALKTKGIEPSSVVIVGVDAIADACVAIKNGDMAFSVCQSAKNQGIAAVEVAQILGNGKSLKQYALADDNLYEVWVEYEKVDAGNVDSYM